MTKLIKIRKGLEPDLHIHPDALEQHKKLGWEVHPDQGDKPAKGDAKAAEGGDAEKPEGSDSQEGAEATGQEAPKAAEGGDAEKADKKKKNPQFK